MTTTAGDIRPVLLAAFGAQGDQFDTHIPTGMAAKLYDFSVFRSQVGNSRYGVNLNRGIVTADGVRAWTTDNEVLDDGSVIAALFHRNDLATSGQANQDSPQTAFLWDLDYRIVLPVRVTGFAQVSQSMGFRLRYKLVKATPKEVATILFWQGQGVTTL